MLIPGETDAIGACVGCGQFICAECNTPLQGKNHCKSCVDEVISVSKSRIEKLEDTSRQTPNVFMNAGGGGGGGASSSSSSSATAVAAPPPPGTDQKKAVLTKSRVVAAVLGILLGGIGVHKFYLGQIGLGILYILLSWTFIPSIVGLIEGIYYLTLTDEVFNAKYGGVVYI